MRGIIYNEKGVIKRRAFSHFPVLDIIDHPSIFDESTGVVGLNAEDWNLFRESVNDLGKIKAIVDGCKPVNSKYIALMKDVDYFTNL